MKKLSAHILCVNMRTVALSCILACTATAASAQSPAPPDINATMALNFNDARIDAVASSVGAALGKNVVVDPKVKGNITLISDLPVTPRQALVQLRAALRMHGYAMIDAGSVFKLVSEADAKTHAVQVNAPTSAAGDIQTRVFTLKHENAAHMVNVVKPLVSANNVVNINPGTNALVITDYADNIARIGQLIASLDRQNSTELEIIPLEHAIATEMVPLLQRLMDAGTSNAPGSPAAGMPTRGDSLAGPLQSTIVADSRSNSLIVRAANPAKLAQIRSLTARLDKPPVHNDSSTGNIHVVHLKHADATALAETLRAAIRTIEQSAPVQAQGQGIAAMIGNTASGSSSNNASGMGTSNTSMGAGSSQDGGLSNTTPLALGQAQMPSVGGLVQADPNTNSLIITAPAPLYRQLRAVIDRLDSRRAQVLVESMIVEVSDNKLAEFGVQWQAAFGNKGDTMGAIGTNSGLAGGNILNIMAGLASGDATQMGSALNSLGGGLNLAIAPKVLGQYYLGALANFLQNDGSSNVLSKPNLMTLDNQEARIIIGDNVPFVTGSYATTGGNNTVNPFTTVERKDVGLMLRIKPTINENGTVKLVVSQEASSIDPTTREDPNGLSTRKRSIESTVLVEDGAIIMLGGLMQDGYSNSIEKVPLLGDLPVMGNLFKSENRRRDKTNLMVFLRPVVMRDAQSTENMAMDRYEEIRAMQQQVQPQASAVLGNVNMAPILPAAQTMPQTIPLRQSNTMANPVLTSTVSPLSPPPAPPQDDWRIPFYAPQ